MIRFILFFALVATSVALAQVQTTNPTGRLALSVVGSLPACAAGTEGTMYGVTDALTPVALSAVTGGGAIHTLVYCNGISWIVG